jgi:hypothetical protein
MWWVLSPYARWAATVGLLRVSSTEIFVQVLNKQIGGLPTPYRQSKVGCNLNISHCMRSFVNPLSGILIWHSSLMTIWTINKTVSNKCAVMLQVPYPFTMIPSMLSGVRSTGLARNHAGSTPCAQDGQRELIIPFRQGCLAGIGVSALLLALVHSLELLVI